MSKIVYSKKKKIPIVSIEKLCKRNKKILTLDFHNHL